MKKEEDVFKKFHDSFNRMEGHFHILEQRIPVELQMEYFKYSEIIRNEFEERLSPYSDENIDSLYNVLLQEDSSEESKKKALTMLAVSRSIKAYRKLETYVKDPDPLIKDWSYMALMELRISLESEFTEEKQIYISTGLGGKNEKMRFYVLFMSKDNLPFQDYQRQVMDREFPYMLSHEDCEIERLSIKDKYVELVFLVPIKGEIKRIIDKVIAECNQYGDFLAKVFTITNVKELNEEEIEEIINKDGDNKTGG